MNDATLDVAQLNAWWTENPDYNIGCAPDRSGHSVLDADPPLGIETLSTLASTHGPLPESLTISTPRGGLHVWLAGSLPSSVQKLGPKLDTRGRGGYVLVPPSIIGPFQYKNNEAGGSYAITEDEDIAEAPAWIAASLAAANDHQVAVTGDVDLRDAERRARNVIERYVRGGDVAVEGAGGDDRTFRLACEILDLGLDEEKAFEIIQPWNDACLPPWSDDELLTKIGNAASYRQNDVGSYANKPAAETFAHIAALALDAPEGKRSIFYPLDLNEQTTQEEPTWLIPSLIPANGTIVVYGKPKSFKSFLALDLCLGLAAGETTFGFKPDARPVVYCAGEGATNIARKHVPAWRLARDRQDDFPFYIVPAVPNVLLAPHQAAELVEQIRARCIKPGIVVIDTMARATGGLDENSSKDVGMFVAACDYIGKELNCSVMIVHHSGKDSTKGSRGSNALVGAVDTVLEVDRHEKTLVVALHVREQRSAAEREEPYTFKGYLVGPSLVFQPIDAATYRAETESDALLSAKSIARALQALDAYLDKPVTTEVLATELARGKDINETTLARQLRAAFKKNDRVSMLADGDPLGWHLQARRT